MTVSRCAQERERERQLICSHAGPPHSSKVLGASMQPKDLLRICRIVVGDAKTCMLGEQRGLEEQGQMGKVGQTILVSSSSRGTSTVIAPAVQSRKQSCFGPAVAFAFACWTSEEQRSPDFPGKVSCTPAMDQTSPFWMGATRSCCFGGVECSCPKPRSPKVGSMIEWILAGEHFHGSFKIFMKLSEGP